MTLEATPGHAAADSYFTLDEADAYFTARGVSAWTGSATAKEAAARKGTSYLDNAYRQLWKGYRTEQTQRLAWPRIGNGGDLRGRFSVADRTFPVYGLVDEDGFEIETNVIPRQVKEAAMEAALLALTGTKLEPVLERGGYVKSVSKGLGPLQKSITYADGAPVLPRFTVIDGLLSALSKEAPGATSGNITLVRS